MLQSACFLAVAYLVGWISGAAWVRIGHIVDDDTGTKERE